MDVRDPATGQFLPQPAAERFWAKVQKSDGCWLWTGGAQEQGYGHFWLDGGNVLAHRWSYEQDNGTISDGLEIDHLCRVPACVRPSHLEPVTRRENQRRGFSPCGLNARKATCPQGHPYSGRDYVGRRICHPCGAERTRRYRSRLAAAA